MNNITSGGQGEAAFDVVVVGGGAAGIGVTASLLRRRPGLKIGVIEPADTHYYQPAWTLVGAGEFDVRKTARPMSSVMPHGASWVRAAAVGFEPEGSEVLLADGRRIRYEQLIVCPGLRLGWEKIEGLLETLGQNGVTSNYHYGHATYTWELVSALKRGKALFTQPAMPIKCAGAPQKAMYLSCDFWRREGVLKDIDVEFNNAGGVLFGVAAFVPPLMKYVEKYGVQLAFNSTLAKVDGARKTAWFSGKDATGAVLLQEKPFDLLHVVPPQVAPEFVAKSAFADAAGWCEVNQETLQHPRYPNVFALGDISSAPSAKTAAAVRKQIVVVAENLIAARDGKPLPTKSDGYGSCPLTVERGKIILAEFGYGGKLLPTFPLDATVPRRSAWYLKAKLLPWIYWNGMLKGHEWLARPSTS
jgi:sulfide:quinone oxidoreductase